METGFDIGLEDLTYEELVMVEKVNRWVEEARNEYLKKQRKEMTR